jgi:hypothetical protein
MYLQVLKVSESRKISNIKKLKQIIVSAKIKELCDI